MSLRRRLPKGRSDGQVGDRLPIVLVPDLDRPLELLLAHLSPAEREQAEQSWPTEHRRRQFVLGRLAAHRAVRWTLAGRMRVSVVEVLTGRDGEPVVYVDGAADLASVSLAHSGRLALACAWPGAPGEGGRAGVDLERVRPTDVARSRYAFSRREREVLACAPEGAVLAGLAAWTVKEAAWKALSPTPILSPVSIEVRALNLTEGRAIAEVPPDRLQLSVRLGFVAGPDGPYVLSIAQLTQYATRNPSAGVGQV